MDGGKGSFNVGFYLNFQASELLAISSNNLLFGLKFRISHFRLAQQGPYRGGNLPAIPQKIKFSAQFAGPLFTPYVGGELYNLSSTFCHP